MNLKRRLSQVEKELHELEAEVTRLSQVRGGVWHERMHYEHLDKKIKILKRRKLELWERYSFDKKSSREEHAVMWDEFKEVKAQIETLEGEYVGQNQERNRNGTRDEVHGHQGGRVDLSKEIQKVTLDAQPEREN